MRLLAPALLAMAILTAPIAIADQSIDQGPAHVGTTNVDAGDGCEDGDSGYSMRTAEVRVDDPRSPMGFQQIGVYSACYAYSNEYGSGSGGTIGVQWTDRQFGVDGPGAYFGWFGWSNDGGAPYCGSVLIVAGVAIPTGCPSPDGSRPPVLPTLP